MATLYDYQESGIEWLIGREKAKASKFGDFSIRVNGGILADEVGLGKTLMSIELIKQNPKPNTLILAPKSLTIQWKREFEKFAPELSVEVTENDDFIFNKQSEATHVVIASHSRLNSKSVSDFKKISYCKVPWDRVIIDEAHVLKNRTSKMHKACLCIQSNIRWALTATPVMNKMDDFVYTLSWVGVPRHICQKYKEQVSNVYIKRRTKEDVFLDDRALPKCEVTIHRCAFANEKEKQLYDDVYDEMREIVMDMKKSDNKNTIQALELLLRVRQVCCHPQTYLHGVYKKTDRTAPMWKHGCTKLNAICDSIKEVPKDDKVLVFCHFIKEMDAYCHRLYKMGIKTARLDGTMKMGDRTLNVETFKTDPECKVFVIQINVGGVGYNFQMANWVYITSPTWNPAWQHQVIGRAHRNGQTKPVHVNIYTISKSEDGAYIEDYILQLQQNKRKMIAELLNDERISEGDTSVAHLAGAISFTDVVRMFKPHKQT